MSDVSRHRPAVLLVLFAAVASRFPPIAVLLPPWVALVAPVLVGAAMGLVAERERAALNQPMPWGWPGACLALGATFFAVVIAQVLDVSVVVQELTPFDDGPLATVSRVVLRPFRSLGAGGRAGAAVGVGAVGGLGVFAAIRHPNVRAVSSALHALFERHRAEGLVLIIGVTLLSMWLGRPRFPETKK
ncbi:MAG: hypothetical protein JNG84_08500 [Archangium sp.]|nr:hypothetical protein [Archangium sp.]